MKKEARSVKLRSANISLILDSYDDIFSDFDPRPYSERALSDDFLLECKHAARDKEKGLELIMFVPKKKKKEQDEAMIKKRLMRHFAKHALEKLTERSKIKHQGVRWFIMGIGFMLTATYFSGFQGPLYHFLVIVFEPAGWFSFWEGLYKVFVTSDEKTAADYDFYKKMSGAKILFEKY